MSWKLWLFAIIPLFAYPILSQAAPASPPDISITRGKYQNYYHMKLKLTASAFELEIPARLRTPKYSSDNSYTFSDWGQFEIFIHKDKFPIPLKEGLTNQYIILRMPGTHPEKPGASLFINEKRGVFDEIRQIKGSKYESLSVIVELNPYIEVVQQTPLKLELTEPNIFFRQAFGRYINYTGPLKPEDQSLQQVK